MELSREDEAVRRRLGISREDFIAEREREQAEKAARQSGGSQTEDEMVLRRTPGITREAFLAEREREQAEKAGRGKAAAWTPTTARADVSAPCPNCQHTAAHPCSASSCNCNGTVPAAAASAGDGRKRRISLTADADEVSRLVAARDAQRVSA